MTLAFSPLLLHPKLILHFLHAGFVLDGALGLALGFAAVDGPCEDHFATTHFDRDLAGIDVGVTAQRLAHVLANPLVAPLIALGPAASVGTTLLP